MKLSSSILRFIIIALAVVALGALAGWYYFLHTSESNINAVDQASGYNAAAPTFSGPTGSTNANIISTFGLPVNGTGSSTSRLWEVSVVPVAGYGWVTSVGTNGATSSPTLYFVERSSGNVLEAQTASRIVLRLSDTLRPKIYQASVTEDGSVLERSVDDSGAVVTFTGSMASSSVADTSSTSTLDSLQGRDLPDDIISIASDPNSDTLYYTIPGSSGISLVSTNWSGEKEVSLFSSAVEGWRLFAPGDGSVDILQAPLDGTEGYAYNVQKGGTLTPLAEGPGLTILPRTKSSALLFGTSQNGTLSLFAQSSAKVAPVQLSLATIADKCAWAPATPTVSDLIAYCGVPQSVPSKQFLDDWYKGIVHTSDEFYEVDATDASTTLLYDPTGDTSAQLDVEDPSVDPSGQYLAFISAADQSLWIVRIAQ